jgi:peptidoglycan biosynthesis protein MviN/MurJ (putative lipid II flippase)
VGPYGAPGLAVASAAAGAVDAGILLFYLRRQVSWKPLLLRLGLVVAGAAVMGGAVWGASRALSGAPVFVAVLVPVGVGLAVYGGFARATPLWRLVRRPTNESDA